MTALLAIVLWLTSPEVDFHAADQAGRVNSWNVDKSACRQIEMEITVTNGGIWQVEMSDKLVDGYWWIVGQPVATNSVQKWAIPNDTSYFFRLTQKIK